MRTILLGTLVLGAGLALPSLGQTFGEITGEVTDSSGAVVIGASVSVTVEPARRLPMSIDVASSLSRSALVSTSTLLSPFCATGIADSTASEAPSPPSAVTRNRAALPGHVEKMRA